MAKIIKADAATFQKEVLDLCTPEPIVVEFSQEGCGACNDLEPAVQKLAAEGKTKVVQVDVGVDVTLAKKYGVAGTPTVAVFKCGKLIVKDSPTGIRELKAMVAKARK